MRKNQLKSYLITIGVFIFWILCLKFPFLAFILVFIVLLMIVLISIEASFDIQDIKRKAKQNENKN